MFQEGVTEAGMSANATHAAVDVGSQFVQSFGAEVGQLPRREVRPHWLHRVEFRRVGGEALHLQPRSLRLQLATGVSAPMCGQTIPQQDHRTTEVSGERAQHSHYPLAIDIARTQGEEHPGRAGTGRESHHPDRREPLPVERLLQDRRLALLGPGAPDTGPLGEASLVPENQRGTGFQRPLLIWGQRFLTHTRIASSSRSMARLAGFWQVHPSLRSRSQTWLS